MPLERPLAMNKQRSHSLYTHQHTIGDVELGRGAHGRLGQPDVEVLVLPRLEKHPRSAALRVEGAWKRCLSLLQHTFYYSVSFSLKNPLNIVAP